MNLNSLVIEKIKELGATKSAAYFNVSVPTIYSWQKRNNAPVAAAQKVMDERPEVPDPAPDVVPTPEMEVAPETVAGEQNQSESPDPAQLPSLGAPVSDPNAELILTNHEARIAKLERWIVSKTEGKIEMPSMISPFSNPNSGMEIKTQPEVIGETPKPADSPPGWNDPKKALRAGGGWNEPIRANAPARPDWNAPLPKKTEQAQ